MFLFIKVFSEVNSYYFFFSSRRRHTRFSRDWSSDVCSSDWIAIADISPGALVDGADLLFADMRYQIDNMEGLSIHVDSVGDTVLTLVSDDNFSILQRTVLLQFKLVDE